MSDDKTASEEAIAKAIDEATTGLKNKNEELLDKLKKRQGEMAEMRDQLDALTSQAKAAEAKKAEEENDFGKQRELLEERHKVEIEKITKALESEKGINRTLLIDNGLTEALTKANVAAPLMPAARALIERTNNIELVDLDGTRAAQIGGQTLGDFVTAWAESEAGSHFVKAPNNSGGGAQGAGDGKAGAKTITRDAFNKMSQLDRANAAKDGVKVVDA